MIIHCFKNGDILKNYNSAIVACFAGPRNILSTAPLNGGRQSGLKYIFNHGGEISGVMKAQTYEGHVAIIAKELGLKPEYSSGMSTAALMENVSIKTAEYGDICVTAAVTGGIDVNAGRVGDKALWTEVNGKFTYVAGTINIFLFIDADLTEGAISRSLVTCTEAKTAAIQELLVPSRFSSGLATGSGTDGTIIVTNPESKVKLTDAGKHFKLGEMIGITVMKAVKEALYQQTGLSPERQMDIFRRMDRFGITEDKLIEKALEKGFTYGEISGKIRAVSTDKNLVVKTSLYAHIIDQLLWGMIPEKEAMESGMELLGLMGMHTDNSWSSGYDGLINAYIDGLLSKLTK